MLLDVVLPDTLLREALLLLLLRETAELRVELLLLEELLRETLVLGLEALLLDEEALLRVAELTLLRLEVLDERELPELLRLTLCDEELRLLDTLLLGFALLLDELLRETAVLGLEVLLRDEEALLRETLLLLRETAELRVEELLLEELLRVEAVLGLEALLLDELLLDETAELRLFDLC